MIPTLNKPTFMREEVNPTLTPAMEAAISVWLSNQATTDSKSVHALRQSAFSTLKKIGLPHSGSEDFTFIRTGEFLPHLGIPVFDKTKTDFRLTPSQLQELIFPECRANYIVLIDSLYAPELSKPSHGYQVKALNKSTSASLSTVINTETDTVAAMAALFAQQPLLIEISAEAKVQNPLQILHYQTKANKRTDSFIVIQSQKLSEGRVLVRHATALIEGDAAGTSTSMLNSHTVALIGEGASLQYLESGSEGNATAIHFRKLTASVDRGSRLTAVSAHTGSKLLRNSFAIDLNGEGAEVDIYGATVLTGKRQAHTFLRIRHLVPHCTSRQHFKSVAADNSKSSVNGTIFVAKDAQGTNAYQLINNLMLSDEARTDSKPQLMIFADDVKCTHGATTGKLDPAQQFYLESRGLNPIQARTLMTVAFIAEILEKAGKHETKAGDTLLGFRATVDHALLDTLKLKLPEIKGGQNAAQP